MAHGQCLHVRLCHENCDTATVQLGAEERKQIKWLPQNAPQRILLASCEYGSSLRLAAAVLLGHTCLGEHGFIDFQVDVEHLKRGAQITDVLQNRINEQVPMRLSPLKSTHLFNRLDLLGVSEGPITVGDIEFCNTTLLSGHRSAMVYTPGCMQ